MTKENELTKLGRVGQHLDAAKLPPLVALPIYWTADLAHSMMGSDGSENHCAHSV